MKDQISPEEFFKVQEEALSINEELDNVLAEGKYVKKQETADSIIKKRELLRSFQKEWETTIKTLPEGENPTMTLNEKAIANMYIADHIFGKDFSMEHIVQCLAFGEEVTDKIKYPQKGSRYFKLEIPDGAGLPGRFVIPNESGTALAEHVANWNQECDYKFRHGELSPVIKKSALPHWLVDLESVFYVIVEKNEILNHEGERFDPPKLQVFDGPTESDIEGSWLISTVHYGQPSRRKPRPPREPKWNKLKKDQNLFVQEIIKYQQAVAKYQKNYDSWSDEQKRVVFVDLEEKGVGQKGVKQESKIIDPTIAGLQHDNEVLAKSLMNAIGEIKALSSEIKGIKTRINKKNKK